MSSELKKLENAYSQNRRNMWVFLIAGVFGCMIFSTIITNAIRDSDYVTYGGEGEAALAAIVSSIIYILPLMPFFVYLGKNKKLRVQVESMKKQLEASSYNEAPVREKEPSKVKESDEYVPSDVPKTEEPKKKAPEKKENTSVKEQLKELKSLYDEKLISKAVYDQKQKDIIDKM